MEMPARKWQGTADDYRYGMNGKEKAGEINSGDYDFGARILDARIGRFLSMDPKASELVSWAPYNAFGDNPIRNIDPDGKKFLNFDKDGNYIGTTHNNWFHNFFFGSRGRMTDASGNIKKFNFADPENDSKDIENGIITKLIVVNQKEIQKMMASSGANDPHNDISKKSPLDGRFEYISQEGVGGGKLDFSYTAIPDMYPGASRDPLNSPSSLIFIVGNMAHNHMNFGNFLFGQAGQNMGFLLPELLWGAHWNSLKNSAKNGYPSQLDSKDDQRSIQKGYENGLFNNKTYSIEVGELKFGGFIVGNSTHKGSGNSTPKGGGKSNDGSKSGSKTKGSGSRPMF